MGRVFFPTYRANIIGVRDVGPQTVLRGLDGTISIPRAPAEPFPRASNNPTGRMLGAAPIRDMVSDGPIFPGPVRIGPDFVPPWNFGYPDVPPMMREGAVPVVSFPATPATLSVPAGPTPPAPAGAAPPVSAQSSPTPVVTMPPQPQPATVLVSSGGGTAAPATAPITIQTGGDVTSGIAAWLKGSTVIFNYNVPNAILAFAAVLGFAWLSSGSTGRRR